MKREPVWERPLRSHQNPPLDDHEETLMAQWTAAGIWALGEVHMRAQ